MFVLSWVLLSVLSAPRDLNSRTANISVCLLAYIAFIPTLRSIAPPVPYVTLNDFVLYSNIIACLVVLLQSFLLNEYGIEAIKPVWDVE